MYRLITERNPITLNTLEVATAQEVFDQAANYMLSNIPLFCKTKICSYRFNVRVSPTDLIEAYCVGGCFISNEEYNHNLEGNTWTELASYEDIPSKHQYLIQDLQGIFDNEPTSDWEEKLYELSVKHRLQFRLE